jgi:hypothetical protein
LLQTVVARLRKMLTGRGVLIEQMGQAYLAEAHAGGEQARTVLLQAAAVTYRIAFGPRAGQKMLTLRGAMPREVQARQLLCADIDGFTRPSNCHKITAPGQVWCWDLTYLSANVMGRWYYLHLILNLYSRKIVGAEVHDGDDTDHAVHLVRRTALAEGIASMQSKPVRQAKPAPPPRPRRCWRYCTGWASNRRTRGPVSAMATPTPSRYSARRSISPTSPPMALPAWMRPGLGRLNSCIGTTSNTVTAAAAAPCRRGHGHPGCAPRAVPRGPTTQPGTLVWRHPQPVASRPGHTRPRMRRAGQQRCGRATYSAEGCVSQATTTLTRAGLNAESKRRANVIGISADIIRHIGAISREQSNERSLNRRYWQLASRPSAIMYPLSCPQWCAE